MGISSCFRCIQDSESLNNDAYMRFFLSGIRCRRNRSIDSIFGMIILICFATFWLGRYRSDRVLVSGEETLLTARPILAFSILIGELVIL